MDPLWAYVLGAVIGLIVGLIIGLGILSRNR